MECNKEQKLLCGTYGFKCFECLLGETYKEWVIKYTHQRAQDQAQVIDKVIATGWTPDKLEGETMPLEIYCPDCDEFVTPKQGNISDPSFKLKEGYTYIEYVCPRCSTILLVARKINPTKERK